MLRWNEKNYFGWHYGDKDAHDNTDHDPELDPEYIGQVKAVTDLVCQKVKEAIEGAKVVTLLVSTEEEPYDEYAVAIPRDVFIGSTVADVDAPQYLTERFIEYFSKTYMDKYVRIIVATDKSPSSSLGEWETEHLELR